MAKTLARCLAPGGAAMLVMLLLGVGVLASPAQANTFTVIKTDDEDEPGTLRRAINLANANANTEDKIVFAASLSGQTITLASQLPAITDPAGLTIDGEERDITISGGDQVRVFLVANWLNVSNTAKLTLRNLTVANGLTESGAGGGIYNQGTLTVIGSTLSGNSAIRGGGISNLNYGTLTVIDSTLSGNSASESGGGISNSQDSTLTVSDSTLSGNSARYYGGGIDNGAGTTLTVSDSTLSDNSAMYGGGLRTNSSYQFTNIVSNSTLSDNSADLSGGALAGWATLKNTIVANSTSGGNCASNSNVTNGGYNLDSGISCGFGTSNDSLSSTDPLLGPLKDNGGSTKTHLLLPGSPALDQGKSFGATTDQRGSLRPVDLPNISNASGGDGSDIGAVEVTPPDTDITDGPSGITRNTSASFSFTSSTKANSSTFECSLNGAAFSSCVSPKSYTSLKNGEHTFRVKAIDEAGHAAPTPAERSWTVDTIKPTITGMTPKPNSFIRSATPTIKATVKDNLTNLKKQDIKLHVDDKQIAASAYSYNSSTGVLTYDSPRLANGKRTVKVEAKDEAGNLGARSWTFTVDTVKPTISAMSPKPGSTITTTTPTITATVKDNLTNLQKKHIKLYVNGKLISPTNYSYNATTHKLTYKSVRLPKGKRTVKIEATDAAGNVGVRSWSFTIK